MIGIIMYIIGIFITPIILKKFTSIKDREDDYDPFSLDDLVMLISLCWPIALVIGILLKIMSFTVWIFNKV